MVYRFAVGLRTQSLRRLAAKYQFEMRKLTYISYHAKTQKATKWEIIPWVKDILWAILLLNPI